MLEKKIALLTSVTFNNIGNGFIDLGAEAVFRSVEQPKTTRNTQA